LVWLFFLASCASVQKPTQPMIYASAALKAAERAQAETRAPDLFRRAESAYWEAKKFYLAKEFEEARKKALEARRLAEEAERAAELKEAESEGG